jgi:ribonuclease P protein component
LNPAKHFALFYILTETSANSLHKHEIVRGKKNVSHLFTTGSRQKGTDLLMIRAPLNREYPDNGSVVRVMFVVSKRNVPKAVERNRIKRMMREAYRHEKHEHAGVVSRNEDDGGRIMLVAFLYTRRKKPIPALPDFRAEIRQFLQHLNACDQQRSVDDQGER